MSSTFHGITPGVAFGKPGPFAALVAAGSSLLTGLVSWWDLDEESGVRADSVIASGNDLTDNNTVLYAAGKIGNAASHVAAQTENLSKASTIFPTSYHVAGWIKPTTVAGTIHFFDCGGAWPNTVQVAIAINGGKIQATIGDGTGFVQTNSTTGPSAGVWNFFDVSYDESTKKTSVSLNNEEPVVGSALSNTADRTSATLYLGCFLDGSSFDYGGEMDLVGIWSRVLTADERTELYNAGSGLDYPF